MKTIFIIIFYYLSHASKILLCTDLFLRCILNILKLFKQINVSQIQDLDVLQKDLVDGHEADKQQLRQLGKVDEFYIFQSNKTDKITKFFTLLFHIELYNPNKDDDSFKNKVKVVSLLGRRQSKELYNLLAIKKEVVKGLSLQRIQQFLHFEADESHLGDQCQVCQEEFEVGRLMKQLDCGGRHSFCSGCIDQWFANHKTCPICRHVFV